MCIYLIDEHDARVGKRYTVRGFLQSKCAIGLVEMTNYVKHKSGYCSISIAELFQGKYYSLVFNPETVRIDATNGHF